MVIMLGKDSKKKTDYSKKLVSDIRPLLWIVTVGGLLLAGYCIHEGYLGSLPWISTMVGLPWTAHGAVCSFYLNMAKSDHRGADGEGITFAAAQARDFAVDENTDCSADSPKI